MTSRSDPSSITNAAAAGVPPAALMTRARPLGPQGDPGLHRLAGETFREEAELADARLFEIGQKSGHK
jgi:hypothetical protein